MRGEKAFTGDASGRRIGYAKNSKLVGTLGNVSIWVMMSLPVAAGTPKLKMETAPVSTASYWNATGLNSRELSSVVNDDICYSSKTNTLACINALSAMLAKLGKSLAANGDFVPDSMVASKTEKQLLEEWSSRVTELKTAPRFSFTLNLRKISEQLSKESKSQIFGAGLNAFLSLSEDPHTYILPIELYEEVYSRSEPIVQSLGLVVRKQNGQLEIKRVLPKSVAEEKGIQAGDSILEAGGISVADQRPTDLNILLSRMGHKFPLKIKREDKIFDVYVSTSGVRAQNVSSLWKKGDKDTLVISIQKFTEGMCEDFKKEIKVKQKEKSIQGLVVDLRDNPGGQMHEATCLLSALIPKGQILYFTNSFGRRTEYKSSGPVMYSGPLAVLVNSGSASASEIVAGSIKELGRGLLVGSKTFGKGSFQNGHVWSLNTKIAIFKTAGLYHFPSGWTPQMAGIEPDIFVEEQLGADLRESDLYYKPREPEILGESAKAKSLSASVNTNGCFQRSIASSVPVGDVELVAAHALATCKVVP